MSNTQVKEMVTSHNALQAASDAWPQEQVRLLKEQVCKDLSDGELQLFLAICKKTKLDPFQRQIYAVKRAGKMTIQTSIDGQRLIAERSGEYAGQEGPFWCGEDGVWKEIWISKTHPVAAKVIIFKKGQDKGTPAVAHWTEYAQAEGFTWKKMPALMLAKCAESLALRKAFPNDLSGLYTTEEFPVDEVRTAAPIPQSLPNQPVNHTIATAIEILKPAEVSHLTPNPLAHELGETVLAIGKYKGIKLKDKTAQEWLDYRTTVAESLLDPAFPAGMRKDASDVVDTIDAYLATL